MEKKIGEIFEYNGEWYQVVECSKDNYPCIGCCGCKRVGGARIFGGECNGNAREDRRFVIFKKLEKVGEPYIIGKKLIQRYKMYPTTYPINVYGWYHHNLDVKSWTIDIEIKQNKNAKGLNSESIEKNLKPFNLDAAKQGKPVCTRDGCKARIICFDRKDNTPIVALIERVDGIEILQCYHNDGKYFHYETSNNDLMMLPEKKEGYANIYRSQIYDTLERAKEAYKRTCNDDNYLQTIKIEWEE